MTQLDFFVRASVPDPYTILGVKLRPFSLGHFFLMRRFDCAFSAENQSSGGILDLLLGIAICSHTYDGFLEFIQDDKAFTEWMQHWQKHIATLIETDKDFNFLHKMMDFESYMKDGVQLPKFSTEPTSHDTKHSGAHWTQIVLGVIMSEYGYDYDRAINMPLSRALADYYKVMEKHGVVTLLTDEEIQMLEEAEKMNHGNQ
jgi:hypothetical protein